MPFRPLALLLALPIALGAQQPASPLRLVPQPRVLGAERAVPLARGITIALPNDADDRFAARDLLDALRARGVLVASGAADVAVSLLRASSPAARRFLATNAAGAGTVDSATVGDGYTIVVNGERPVRVAVVGGTAAGVFYGAQTLKQLVDGTGHGAVFHAAAVRDWPAMRWRGFHDDLSRGPIPTLEYQKKQIRTFAAHKLNVYSPYYEHTLRYPSHPLVGPPQGAMTPEDVKELVAYAKPYHIEIVPEQEAFGHLHHLLKYELYSTLAETPHGHVLAPGQPGSIPLIAEMFAHIDSLFPSRFVHLGADETFELGRGQTRERVEREGIGPVYLGFLTRIVEALKSGSRPADRRAPGAKDRKYLFWADIAQNHPDLVKTLPKDLLPIAWSYGAARSFDRLITPFTNAGLETWVAPGVSNWNRVYPNNDVALRNIQGFVRDGQRLGATGMLNTNWDDDGEGLFEQTWYGVLFGAAAAWQPGESSIDAYAHSYGRVFHGDTTGKIDEAQRKLSAAHALLGTALNGGDGSNYLFWVDPYSSEGRLTAAQLRPVLHDLRVLAESASVLLAQARATQPLRETDALDAIDLGARRFDFIGMKFQLAEEIVHMYARAAATGQSSDTTRAAREGRANAGRELSDITGINGRLQDLRDGYSLIRDLYEQAWRRENRPYWLHNVLARYDLATQLWLDRIDRVTAARREWNRTRKLPGAETVGIGAP